MASFLCHVVCVTKRCWLELLGRRLSRPSTGRQVRPDLLLKQPDELWSHVLKLVWDAQDSHALATQLRPELGCDLGAVSGLHDQHSIRPHDQLSRNWAVRVMAGPGGSRLNAWPVREHLLRGRAAQTVLATDKENVVRQSVACDLTRL